MSWWKGKWTLSARARHVKEFGTLPPWWYGYAHHQWHTQTDVYYPVPFNWFAWLGWWIQWRWARVRSRESPLDRAFFRELNVNREAHYREGVSSGAGRICR